MFDLYLLPLKLAAGQEINEMPGLLVATAPRRCDRSRSGDTLMVLLTLQGPSDAVRGMHDDLFERLVTAYYRTRGTITTGLRTAIAHLNDHLTKRNLHERGSAQVIAVVNIAVLRRDMLYLAQSGETQSLLITKDDFTRFSDDDTGRGLGIGRSFNLRFWQARIQPDDLLVFAPQPPAAWSAETLTGSGKLTLDAFRRRLLGGAGSEVEAGILQFKPGDGQVHRLKPRQAAPDLPPSAPVDTPPIETAPPEVPPLPVQEFAADAPAPLQEIEAPAWQAAPPEVEESPRREEIWSQPYPTPHEEAVYRSAADEPGRAYRAPAGEPPAGIYLGDARPHATAPPPLEAQPDAEPSRPPFKLPTINAPQVNVRKPLANIWRASKSARQKVDTGSRSVAGRLVPERSLSPGVMLFIAIAVPLLIVASAVTVYLYAPSGRSEQQAAFIEQAIEYVGLASSQEDQTLRRSNWAQAQYWVEKAEEYGATSETLAIRRQIRSALDAMDGVARIVLEPTIIGGLPSSVRITRVVASPSEVFLLDAESGRVLRLFRTANGYEHDTRFLCAPGPSGALMISPLVDIELLPASNEYSLLAVDQTGNILKCKSGQEPTSVQLPMPDPVWGSISAMTIEQGVLYLLDKPNNRIWLYVGSDYNYSDEPRLFFNDEVPPLHDVIDMAANNEDLYLLHEDGHMTTCIFRSFSFSQTRCTEPSPYNDQRPGRSQTAQVMPGTRFVQMQTTSPPDPSLYMLDAAGPSIYHFSLRLNLQNHFAPDPEIEYIQAGRTPGAFAISSSRVIYLAIGNQVYFAAMPF